MKKIEILVSIIFLSIAFSKCKPSNNELSHVAEGELVFINVKKEKELLLSDLFEKVSYLPIQLPEGMAIGQFDKVIIEDEKIIIGDFYQSNQILILDTLGNFLANIKNLGDGPGNYIQLTDFSINTADKSIDILSPNKILQYNFDGEFISESKLPMMGIYKFMSMPSNDYVFYIPENLSSSLKDENSDGAVLFIYSQGKPTPILEDRRGSKNIPFMAERSIMKQFEDKIAFSTHFSDTIYLFKEREINTKFVLDFGKRKFPIEDFDIKGEDILNDPEYLERHSYHVPNLHYDGDFLISTYIDGEWVTFFYQISSERFVAGARFINDLDNGLTNLHVKALDKGQVYSFHYPEEFDCNKLATDTQERAYWEKLGLLDPNVNFVIAKYSFWPQR